MLYNKDLSAKLIVEYKAPHIEITQTVFDQITRYNMVLKVDYLIVSNGLNHYCCHIDYNTKHIFFYQRFPTIQNCRYIKNILSNISLQDLAQNVMKFFFHKEKDTASGDIIS